MSKPVISQQDAEAILTRFDFYTGTLDEFSIIPQRLTNQNARIRIGDKKWVIKRYDTGNTPPNLVLSHTLQAVLREQGFPIAILERNQQGQSLIEHGAHQYSLHQWVDGVHHNHIETGAPLTDTLIQEVARTLGQFHKIVAQRFPHDADAPLTLSRQLFAAAETGAQDFLAPNRLRLRGDTRLKLKWNKTSLDRLILSALPRFEALAKQLAKVTLDDINSLQEIVLTHNDINWLNLIFDEHEHLRAIIDFDNIQYAPRQMEIGSAALVVAGGNANHFDTFITAYQAAADLSVDVRATRLSMLVRSARSFFWSIQAYRQGAIHDVHMLECWIRYLDDNVSTLTKASDFQVLLKG